MRLPVKVSKQGHCNVYLVTLLPCAGRVTHGKLAEFNTGAVLLTQRSLLNVTTGFLHYGALFQWQRDNQR